MSYSAQLQSSVDTFDGSLTFSIPLLNARGRGGLDLHLEAFYDSSTLQQATTWNLDAPTGPLGLGWTIPFDAIVAAPAGNAALSDRTYTLVSGGRANRLYQTGVSNGLLTFALENYLFWSITYDPAAELWSIIHEDGVTYSYGGLVGLTRTLPVSANAVQYSVVWGNWIDSSNQTLGQQRVVSAWNLRQISDRFGDSTQFFYRFVDVNTGTGSGLGFTQQCYLASVVGVNGETFVLNYDDKNPSEYQQAHTNPPPPNAYQDPLQSQYLENVQWLSATGDLLQQVNFSYAPSFLGSGTLSKRLLTSITTAYGTSQVTLPGWQFSYWGQSNGDGVSATTPFNGSNGALYGAMQTVTLPEGGTVTWNYQQVVPALSARNAAIAPPSPAGYGSPRFYFESEYVVVTWLGSGSTNSVAVQVYAWDGQWIAFSGGSIPLTSQAQYTNVSVATSPSSFAVWANGQLHLFAADTTNAGGWIQPAVSSGGNTVNYYSPTFTGSESTSLVSGDGFAALLGLTSGTLYRYRFTGLGWVSDATATIGTTGATYAIATSHNLLTVGWIMPSTRGAPLNVVLYPRDGAGNWPPQPIAFQPAVFSSKVTSIALYAGDSFVVCRGVNAVAGQQQVQFGAFIWTPTFGLANATPFESLLIGGLDPVPAPVISGSLVAVNAQTYRFDGVLWISFDLSSLTVPNQQSINALSVSADRAARQIAAGTNNWVYDLAVFNPNTGTWSVPAGVSTTTSNANLAIAAASGDAVGNFAVTGSNLYYEQPDGTWTNDLALTGISTAADAASVQLLGQTYAVYQSGSGSTATVYVLLLANGTVNGPAIPLTNQQISVSGQPASLLVGPSSFITYTGTFGASGSQLTLNRPLNGGVSGAQTTYAVNRQTASTGYASTTDVPGSYVTGFTFDVTKATIDSTGVQPRFNQATTLPGNAAATYGSIVDYYFNALPPGVLPLLAYPVDPANANAQSYTSASVGLCYARQTLPAGSATPVQVTTHYLWITVPQLGNIACGAYCREQRTTSLIDGVTLNTVRAYSTASGMVTNEQRTNVNSLQQQQTFSVAFTYFWQQYDPTRSLNLLSPVIQTVSSTANATTGQTTTGAAVTTWKDDWGSGTGKWAPYRKYAALTQSAASAGFSAWSPSDPPPANWLLTETFSARNSAGLITSEAAPDGTITSIVYDRPAMRFVASCVNADATAEEFAYFGAEPYESLSGWTWSDGTSLWSHVTTSDFHTGTQSILLSPIPSQSVGPVQLFTPGGQQRRYVFSSWARVQTGFNPANGTAQWQITIINTATGAQVGSPFTIVLSSATVWTYVQYVVDLPAIRTVNSLPASTSLSIKVFGSNQNTTSGCFVDELRFSPVDGNFTASVTDVDDYLSTATLGHDGQDLQTVYDVFRRPAIAIGPGTRVNAVVTPAYSRALAAADAFNPQFPNSVLRVGTASDSQFFDFHDGSAAGWTFSDPSNWSVANGSLTFTGSDTTGIGSTAQFSTLAHTNFAARVISASTGSTPASISIGNNDVFLQWNAAGNTPQWQLVRVSGTTVTVLATSAVQGFRSELIYAVIDGFYVCYADGIQLFATTIAPPSTPPPGWGLLTLALTQPGTFDDLAVIDDPQLGMLFADGLGNAMQTIGLAGRTPSGAYPVASGGIFRDALLRPAYMRNAAPAPLQIAAEAVTGSTASLVAANENSYLFNNAGTQLTVDQYLSGSSPADGYEFSELTFETSPLSRVVSKIAPRPSGAAASLYNTSYAYGSTTNPTGNSPGANPSYFLETASWVQSVDTNNVVASVQRNMIRDMASNVIAITEGAAGAPAPNTAQYIYDDFNRLVTIRQPNYFQPPAGSTAGSWVETRAYTYLGAPMTRTTPDTGSTSYLYDNCGRLRFTLDANGAALVPVRIDYLKYDALGRVIESGYIQDPNYDWSTVAAKVNVAAFPIVDPSQSADPNYATGQWSRAIAWDYLGDESALYLLGRVAQASINGTPAASTETYSYDVAGNITKKVDTNQSYSGGTGYTTEFAYNAQNQLTLITYPKLDSGEALKVGYYYDRLGRIAAIGQAVPGTGVIDPSNPPTPPEEYYAAFGYDGNGLLATQTSNNGASLTAFTRTFSYDPVGRPLAVDDPYMTEQIDYSGGTGYQNLRYYDGSIASTAVSYKSSAQWSAPPQGLTFNYAYDPLQQLTQAASSLGSASTTSAANAGSYDANGNIVNRTRGITTSTYSYGTAPVNNQVQTVTGSASDSMNFEGVPIGATSANGWSWGSNNGGPTQTGITTSDSHGGTQCLQLYGGSLGHYDFLQFNSYIPQSGTYNLSCWVKTASGFDTAGGKASWYAMVAAPAGGTVAVRLGSVPAGASSWTQFTLPAIDIASLRTTLGLGENLTSITLVLRNEKRGASGSTGPFVLVDDISFSGSYTTPAYGYDADGNVGAAMAGDMFRLQYDPVFNLPASVQFTSGSGPTVTYAYSGAGERVNEKLTSGGTTQSNSMMLYGASGSPLVLQTQSGGVTSTTYLIDGPLGIVAWVRDGTLEFPLTDHLGSTRVIVDSTTANAVNSFDYMPFGDLLRAGATPNEPYLYTGQPFDAITQLYDCEARQYDTELQRFYAADSAGSGFASYSYAENNPISFADPSGRVPWQAIFNVAVPIVAVGVQAAIPWLFGKLTDLPQLQNYLERQFRNIAETEKDRILTAESSKRLERMYPYMVARLRSEHAIPVEYQNAMAHFLWQFYITQIEGEAVTRQLGATHENEKPGPLWDTIADKINNEIALRRALELNNSWRWDNQDVTAGALFAKMLFDKIRDVVTDSTLGAENTPSFIPTWFTLGWFVPNDVAFVTFQAEWQAGNLAQSTIEADYGMKQSGEDVEKKFRAPLRSLYDRWGLRPEDVLSPAEITALNAAAQPTRDLYPTFIESPYAKGTGTAAYRKPEKHYYPLPVRNRRGP